MKTEKLGQEPIIPTAYRQIGENEFRVANEKDLKDPYSIFKTTEGMSKRFYAACAAMQGLLANGRYDQRYYEGDSTEIICKRAFKIADELLKQESE